MATIPSRELRNDVAAILRRVEAGESMTVTVSGRPVARVVPIDPRPTTMPWSIMASALDRIAADRDLVDDLLEALPDSTDDLG